MLSFNFWSILLQKTNDSNCEVISRKYLFRCKHYKSLTLNALKRQLHGLSEFVQQPLRKQANQRKCRKSTQREFLRQPLSSKPLYRDKRNAITYASLAYCKVVTGLTIHHLCCSKHCLPVYPQQLQTTVIRFSI